MKFLYPLILASIMTAISTAHGANKLSLQDYLEQVRGSNSAVKGARLQGEGGILEAQSASVIQLPYLFANYTNFDDRSEQANPTFSGNRTKGNQYTIGLSNNTPIGLNAKYSYNVAYTEIQNASAIPVPNFYTAYNKLELQQQLWKNGFGSEVRAQATALGSSKLVRAYSNKHTELALHAETENSYWRLAFARRSLEVQREMLTRAGRLLEWARNRVKLQLGDKADLLQAQANYDLRRLDMINLREMEKNAALAFNMMRNREGDIVPEELEIPSLDQTIKVVGKQNGLSANRYDVQAAEQQMKAAVASSQLDREKLKPSVDLFGNISWSGRDANRGLALEEAKSSKRSNVAFGVNLSIPLAVPQALNAMKGNSLTQEGAAISFDQKKIEADTELTQLKNSLNETLGKLELIQSLERIQKEKYENENQRLLRGRTTTYQALIFEQDYSNTQLSRLRIQNDALQLVARMNLFRTSLSN